MTASPRSRIAYFSMEVGIDARLPIYSGGLGALAGDTLRTFADLRVPAVGVSLLYRCGYFRQRLARDGTQIEAPVQWDPSAVLTPLEPRTHVTIRGRDVAIRAWQYAVRGVTGGEVPIFLLDTNLPENAPADCALTDVLYGGDEEHRLAQEVVLGIGGVRMLRALGLTDLERFHMNEGHSALLALELLYEEDPRTDSAHDIDVVRRKCIFTTHTPVAAGHDRYPYALVERVVGDLVPIDLLRRLGGADALNMTLLALNLSHFVNGVAKRHGETTQHLFPGYPIDSITNGVHSATWTSDSFAALYDQHIPGWRRDPMSLRYAIQIGLDDIWAAHLAAKRRLTDVIAARTGRPWDPNRFLIGFARRATGYKRPELVLRDVQRLKRIALTVAPFQIVYAGKAHPRDAGGKALITQIVAAGRALAPDVPLVYLEDYDLDLARLMTGGVDLWLNTPLPPFEASGTSGMKAAHNGVPSLSTLDGWWIEGHVEGVTGWSLADADELYAKLEHVILPLYRDNRRAWMELMRRTIVFNASFFNSHRMIEEYAVHGYL